MTILLSILFGWAFDRAQMVMSAKNYGAIWNGYGAITLVNKREAKAPMAYRVLVPWIVALMEKLLPKVERLVVYQTLKLAGVVYAFWACWHWIGLTATLICFMLLLVTVEYDYWDWAIELGGIAIAMSCGVWAAIGAVMLYAMSRETWPLAAAAYGLASGDWVGAFVVLTSGGMVWAVVRLIVGEKSLYCKRFMIRENWQQIKEIKKWNLFYYVPTFISLMVTILVIAGIVNLPQGWPVPLALIGAGWAMAKANEPRVFSAALPWAAVWIWKGLL